MILAQRHTRLCAFLHNKGKEYENPINIMKRASVPMIGGMGMKLIFSFYIKS